MKRLRCRYALILAGLLPLLSPSLLAQKKAGNIQDPGMALKQVEASTATSTLHYHSGNRRDPFLNPILTSKRAVSDPNAEAPRGPRPPGIAGMFIGQVRLMGIAFNENTTAVFEGTDKRAYFLQEKDKLYDGYIKKIAVDSVVLIRETKLMSGKVVTQEVVKRLRTP
jgi:hypothetical protein